MRFWISGLIFSFVKMISRIFYTAEVKNVHGGPLPSWKNVKLLVLMHHTSLYEFLFLQSVPLEFLWKLPRNMIMPGADKTLKRPLTGLFFKLLVPGMISITRKRDNTWDTFLQYIDPSKIVMIIPEGRMKRPTGLDSEGKPMSVRGGVADILQRMHSGDMLIAYSGGLHHVQVPGQTIPNLFQKIKVNLELLPIADFKAPYANLEPDAFKKAVITDLEARMKKYVP